MVNRILSLQLAFTLVASQAWALSGGPYDGALRLSSMSGTYGASLYGSNDSHKSTTGVMLLSVPLRGLSVGKMLVFDQGLMYAGTATGVVNISGGSAGGGSATMIAQLAHYVVRTQSSGVGGSTGAFMDSRYNGVMKLKISPDYFTGVTTITGTGDLFLENLRLLGTVTETETETLTNANDNAQSTPVITTTKTTNTQGDSTEGAVKDAGTVDIADIKDGKASDLKLAVDGLMQSSSPSQLDFFGAPAADVNWGINPGEKGDGAKASTIAN